VRNITAPVENDFRDARFSGPFRHKLADRRGGILVRAGFQGFLQILFQTRRHGQRFSGRVVDNLGINMRARTAHREPDASFGFALDLIARAPFAAFIQFFCG